MTERAKNHRRFILGTAVLLLLVCPGVRAADADKRVKILVVKSRDLTSYNLAVDGFREEMASGYIIRECDLGGKLENVGIIRDALRAEDPGLILAVGAKAVAALGGIESGKPVVFCMVLNPEKYDLKKINATGVSLEVSAEAQMEILLALSSEIKKVGVLMRGGEEGNKLLKKVIRMAEARGAEIVPVIFDSEKEIPRKLRSVVSDVKALWMLDDAYIHSRDTLQFVILTSLENNLPFLAISEVFVKEGALISLSPSFYGNGKQAGALVKEIIGKKKRPAEIPVSLHANPDLIVSKKIARKIGITIPPQILERAKRIYE